jgi:hypothetical protein
MKTEAKHTAFHWPDHTIGKRESRAIRESHNALYNDLQGAGGGAGIVRTGIGGQGCRG